MKTRLISLLLLAVVALGACSEAATSTTTTVPEAETTTAPATPATVEVRQFMFDPGNITVVPGTTVTWNNQDRILHTVTAGTPEAPIGGGFDVEMPDQGTSAQLTFDEPGTYDYFCSRHTHMVGTVTVEG